MERVSSNCTAGSSTGTVAGKMSRFLSSRFHRKRLQQFQGSFPPFRSPFIFLPPQPLEQTFMVDAEFAKDIVTSGQFQDNRIGRRQAPSASAGTSVCKFSP